MKLVIAGNSKLNKTISQYAADAGFSPVVIEDPGVIRRISGEVGCFKIITDTGMDTDSAGISATDAAGIILTEDAHNAGIGTDFKGFSDAEAVLKCRKGDRKKPVVFVLDYPAESSASEFSRALELAHGFSCLKFRAYVLARSMRTSGHGIEGLYADTRDKGVTFIKYSGISFNGSMIDVCDDYGWITLDAGEVFFAGNAVDSIFDGSFARKTGIRLDENGLAAGGKFYTCPVFTSRRGIYYINTGLSDNSLESMISSIFTDLKTLISQKDMNSTGGHEHAEVDSGKCAFCYTCYRACPHGAMAPDEEAGAMKNLGNACHACGICVSICPADAITLIGETDSQCRAGTAADSRVKIFTCENSGMPVLRELFGGACTAIDIEGMDDIEDIDIEALKCGGDAGAEKIADALEHYEKVMVIVCNDEACRHFDGNKRASLNIDRVHGLLDAAGPDKDRVRLIRASHAMPQYILDNIRLFLREG